MKGFRTQKSAVVSCYHQHVVSRNYCKVFLKIIKREELALLYTVAVRPTYFYSWNRHPLKKQACLFGLHPTQVLRLSDDTLSANCRSAQCSWPGCGLGVQKLVLDELWCQQETNQRCKTWRLLQKRCHPGPGQTTLSGAASDTRVGRPDAHTHTHRRKLSELLKITCLEISPKNSPGFSFNIQHRLTLISIHSSNQTLTLTLTLSSVSPTPLIPPHHTSEVKSTP